MDDDVEEGCESGARCEVDVQHQGDNKDKGKVDSDIDEDGNDDDDPFLDDDGICIAGG